MTDKFDPWHLPLPPASSADRAFMTVRRFGPVEPLKRQIGVWPKRNVPDKLDEPLFGEGDEAAYALLDAACLVGLPQILEASGLPHCCLFKGAAREALAEVAPWLVALTPDSALAREMFTTGKSIWATGTRHPAIFLRTTASLDSLSRHLRRFVRLKDEAGHWSFFRFWDSAVLGGYLELQAQEGTSSLCRSFLSPDGHGLTIVLNIDNGTWLVCSGDGSASRQPLLLGTRDRDHLSRPLRARYAAQVAAECKRRIGALPAPLPARMDDTCRQVADFVHFHGGASSATVRQGVALATILLMMDPSAQRAVLTGPVMRNPDLPLGDRIEMTANSFITAVERIAGGSG